MFCINMETLSLLLLANQFILKMNVWQCLCFGTRCFGKQCNLAAHWPQKYQHLRALSVRTNSLNFYLPARRRKITAVMMDYVLNM